jgi:hypothetical protein
MLILIQNGYYHQKELEHENYEPIDDNDPCTQVIYVIMY